MVVTDPQYAKDKKVLSEVSCGNYCMSYDSCWVYKGRSKLSRKEDGDMVPPQEVGYYANWQQQILHYSFITDS